MKRRVTYIIKTTVFFMLIYSSAVSQQVTFSEKTNQAGVVMDFFSRWSTGQAWTDYDNDGFLDVYITAWGQASTGLGQNALFQNKGAVSSGKEFQNVASSTGVQRFENSVSSAWADFDNDGDEDLFVANFSEGDIVFKNLLTESGSAIFLDVTSSMSFINESIGRSMDAVWGDYNNDGFLEYLRC